MVPAPWPDERVQRVRDLATDHTPKEIAEILGFSTSAINNQLQRHHIKAVFRHNMWTEEQDAYLHKLLKKHTAADAARIMEMSFQRVRTHLYKQGVQTRGSRKTKGKYTLQEAAAELGVTINRARRMLHALGRAKHKRGRSKWSPYQITSLDLGDMEQYLNTINRTEVAKQLGVHLKTLDRMCEVTGVTPFPATREKRFYPPHVKRLKAYLLHVWEPGAPLVQMRKAWLDYQRTNSH